MTPEEERALRAASRAEGVSQSELIRRGIRLVAGRHLAGTRPTTGWLQLNRDELDDIAAERFGDPDA